MTKIAPDKAVIISGLLSKNLKQIKPAQILIHETLLKHIYDAAILEKAEGMLGLDEIERIRAYCKSNNCKLEIISKNPHSKEEVDYAVVEMASDEDAIFVTSDKNLAKFAGSCGRKFLFIEPKIKKLKLEEFFDPETMSIHLKEDVLPYAKKGGPGDWRFDTISDKKMTNQQLKEISREIIESSKCRSDGFIEIERPGSTIVQLGRFRIIITKPPFSDGWEITAVRPIKTMELQDYNLEPKLTERLNSAAEGILVAGAPGMGKSTWASALAKFYASKDRIVKTIEAPRDLVLPDNITQYATSYSTHEELHDILLLSRPDYTIFDEIRNTEDFELFSDLRLAGVGMVGVVHATEPVDAIQRFISRVEIGLIPHIINTVIFIEKGEVAKVLKLSMTVKVPNGMTEADLARPVVLVKDFASGATEYEIYSYGEQTVVMPVVKAKKSGTGRLASEKIREEFLKITEDVKVELLSADKARVFVPKDMVAKVIGKEGKVISGIEAKLGIRIDVDELLEKEEKTIEFEHKITKTALVLYLDPIYKNTDIGLYVGNEFVMRVKAGKTGVIKINRKNKICSLVIDELNSGGDVKLMPEKR